MQLQLQTSPNETFLESGVNFASCSCWSPPLPPRVCDPFSGLMLHVVFRYTLMVISSCSSTFLHLNQFLSAGGKTLHLCGARGFSPTLSTLSSRTECTIMSLDAAIQVMWVWHNFPARESVCLALPTPQPAKARAPRPHRPPHRVHDSRPEWVSISKHVASIPGSFKGNTAVYRGGGECGTHLLQIRTQSFQSSCLKRFGRRYLVTLDLTETASEQTPPHHHPPTRDAVCAPVTSCCPLDVEPYPPHPSHWSTRHSRSVVCCRQGIQTQHLSPRWHEP